MGPRGFRGYRAGERRRIIVTLTLLCSDLISAFLALALVDSVFGFSRIETALTALAVLIGLFWVSGLYSGSGLSPGRAFARALPRHPRFCGHVPRCRGTDPAPDRLIPAACQGILVFLLGYYAEALTRRALIRRELWGAATAFVGTGPAIEQAVLLLSAIPELGLRPVGYMRTGEAPASLDRDEIEFIVAATKADFAGMSNATRFVTSPPRVLLLQPGARRPKTFSHRRPSVLPSAATLTRRTTGS